MTHIDVHPRITAALKRGLGILMCRVGLPKKIYIQFAPLPFRQLAPPPGGDLWTFRPFVSSLLDVLP